MISSPVIIIGAGVSGLAAASILKQRGIAPLILEARSFVGGAVRTVRHHGYLCEYGPNTFMLSNPEVVKFLQQMGLLDSALDAAPHAKKRFVVQRGKLIPLPNSPRAMMTSNLLSWGAKLRMLCEPFVPKGRNENESVAQFVRRRLGEEPLHELVDPFISGIYAGNSEKLIVRYTMPKWFDFEQSHGNLFLGILKSRRTHPRLLSWAPGLSGLAAGLAAPLENELRLSTRVHSLRRNQDSFSVFTERGEFKAKKIIVATDATSAARLLEPIFSGIAPLKNMPHAPIVVVHLGWKRSSIGHPLNGFGVLISRKRGIRTLGALFSSTLFPGRAPEGRILLTAFIGGSLDSDVLSLEDSALVRTVWEDLTPLLDIVDPPIFQNVVRWPRAIPQYETDYPQILRACEEIEGAHPGLHLIGNYRGGISLESCLANGYALGATLEPFKP